MADFAELQQLITRYGFAHDSQDPLALAETFASDVELLGIKGRDAVVAKYAEGYRTLTARRRHVLTNFILLEDGEERAVIQSYITLYLIREDTLALHLIGVYRDTCVFEEGAWRIRTRESTMDTPYNPGDAKAASADTYQGSKKR